MPSHEFRCLGLDLGQSTDYSAACLLTRRVERTGLIGPRDDRIRCRALRRWPLGSDYCEVVSDVLQLPVDVIVVDFGGCGRPVVDLLRREAMRKQYPGRIRPVAIVASDARVRKKTEERGSHWLVPKIDLIAAVSILQEQRMVLLPDIPETKILLQEVRDFRMRYTKKANVQFGNEPGAGRHDDLVLSFALAGWWMIKFGVREAALEC